MNKSMKFLAVIAATLVLAACHDDDPEVPLNIPQPLVNTFGTVEVTGETIRGATLTANASDFNGISGPITYQWAADGADIAGATGNTYVLTDNEIGATITVTASYTDDEGFSESVTSDPTAVVTLPPNEAGQAAITGVPAVDEVLTASVTDGNGTTTSMFAYQWLADGADVAGATMETYTITLGDLDALISVNVTYTDDDGYAEDTTSDTVGPIVLGGANVPGTIAISGTPLVGETLTATVTDPNGFTAVNYQWAANGVDVVGATTATFDLTSAEIGTLMSVTADYTDDDGFAEGPISADASDIIYTVIVVGETTLQAAAAGAVDGDVIGLDSPSGDDYIDMAEVQFTADNLIIKRVAGSTAVISGTTCIAFEGDNSLIDGLVFDDLDWQAGGRCESNGNGSVFLNGTGSTFSNNEFLGEAYPRTRATGDEYHYMTLKGIGNVVERNLFQGKNLNQRGAAISVYSDDTAGQHESHIIQYNLVKDFIVLDDGPGNGESTAYAFQIGRSSSADATGDGFHTVRYNRFDTVQADRRLILVQGGRQTIHGNTIVDSLGLIALEDGYGSTVSSNIIISAGDVGDDGGISFAPLGHTVVDNYVNNLRTTSDQRAGLMLNMEPIDASGNRDLHANPALDHTVTVANNTVVNARRAIQFENDSQCDEFVPILDFDNNFVMNQSSALSINGNSNGEGRAAVIDDDWVGDATPCSFDPATSYEGNHFYSASLSVSGTFDFAGNLAGNTVGGEDGATFTAPDANNMVNGAGADAGVGADITGLHFILESEVGPGSTWTATP